jgi:hypothetical protein
MSRAQVTADQSVGRLLSWLTGRKSIENAGSPTSAAAGLLVAWITGKKKRRSPVRRRSSSAAGRLRARPAGSQGQGTHRVRMVMPPWGRPPASAAARTQKCDHMLSWISLASRSLL